MNKGDLFTVYFNGAMTTVCVLGSYREEFSGEEMVVLALIKPDNLFHIPLDDLKILYAGRRIMN